MLEGHLSYSGLRHTVGTILGKCKWSYGPSCPMVFSIKYIHSFILYLCDSLQSPQKWTILRYCEVGVT